MKPAVSRQDEMSTEFSSWEPTPPPPKRGRTGALPVHKSSVGPAPGSGLRRQQKTRAKAWPDLKRDCPASILRYGTTMIDVLLPSVIFPAIFWSAFRSAAALVPQ